MLQTNERKPIVSESTPEAADFTDRLGNLRYDVRMIELGVEVLRQHYNGGGNDIEAIIMACRRLEADVDMLADEILPPHSEEENERVAEILRESANDKHTAELRRIERVTGVKLAAAEVVAMEADRTMSC